MDSKHILEPNLNLTLAIIYAAGDISVFSTQCTTPSDRDREREGEHLNALHRLHE